jgi:Fe2+ transport system protein B|tara:strand:+ start:558 stop:947 length:390 start_codon:yes stop_codon:yes gene_type:complete
MLGLGKLRVLESKLDIYEDLSKEMLDKLERAVSSIQETNNRVAVILERHENRLDEGERANDSILRLIEKVEEDVKSLESKVDSLSRFRWVALGVAATAMLIVNVLQISSDSFVNNRNVLPDVAEQVEKK